MKFIFFGYDFSLNVLERLVADGHDCIGIQTFECDNIFNFNTGLLEFAKSRNIPARFEKPDIKFINDSIDKGCNLFLTAGYPYKVPCVDESKAYMVNMHPSLLPVGRGIMPTPHVLLHTPEASGITLHKMVPEFDAGDILMQLPLPLSEQEDVEMLSARTAMAAPDLVSKLIADLPRLWKNAVPQDHSKAVSWDAPTDAMRTIDFRKSIKDIEKVGRAFGRYGSLVEIDGKNYATFDFSCWSESHLYEPGTIVLKMSREIVVAAKDGFVCLKDVAELAPA